MSWASSAPSSSARERLRRRSPPALRPLLPPPGRLETEVIKVSILVVSSKIAEGREEDNGKKSLSELVESIPAVLLSYEVVPDDASLIRERLKSLTEAGSGDVVLTLRGTGVARRDLVRGSARGSVEQVVHGLGVA